MPGSQPCHIRYILLGFLLLWSCTGPNVVWADTWASPTTQEYRSSNDKYVARVVPALGIYDRPRAVLEADEATHLLRALRIPESSRAVL